MRPPYQSANSLSQQEHALVQEYAPVWKPRFAPYNHRQGDSDEMNETHVA